MRDLKFSLFDLLQRFTKLTCVFNQEFLTLYSSQILNEPPPRVFSLVLTCKRFQSVLNSPRRYSIQGIICYFSIFASFVLVVTCRIKEWENFNVIYMIFSFLNSPDDNEDERDENITLANNSLYKVC